MIASIQLDATNASNPFSTRFVRPGSLEYRFCGDVDQRESEAKLRDIVQRLGRHRTGLIVGPHGSGKTTLLHSLAPWFNERHRQIVHLRLAGSPSRRVLDRIRHARRTAKMVHRRQALVRSGGLLIVDGAEQLARFDLARLLIAVRRGRQTMLATSHFPIWGMPILHETEIDADLVESLTQSLLADASPEVAKIVRRQLLAQDWSTLTNVRDLWFDLYDAVGPLITPSHR